jgi:hypothetical protein
MSKVELNIKALENLIKDLVVKKEVRVGIFEENNNRPDGQSNASIGLDHEFGRPSIGLPMRSFLREPIFSREKQIEEVANNAFKEVVEGNGNLDSVYEAIGEEALHIVKGAFETGGYGDWKKLSPITEEKKGNNKILVDQGYLQDSITSKVVKL